MLEISLLGQFDLRLNGQPVELPSRPAQSLLAYLLIRPGAAHRREKLAGLLWPDTAEANARSYLRQALWRIRKALEPGGSDYLLADDLTIAFDANSDYRLDLTDLEREVAAEGSTDELVHCVAAYRGELLPGFYHEWVLAERERLHAVFEYKMNLLLNRLVAERRSSDVLAWGERWIALGHAPEPAYRALMTAHSRLGDRSSMAAVYQRCVEALRRELGVEPSEPTRALYERLLRSASSGDRAIETSRLERKLLFASAAPADLPRQLTSFIGREREIAEVKRLLPTSRLVTLTGVGGCGKTRLALQVSHELLAEYPQGVWFVELAPLAEPTLVPKTVAATLGLLEEPGRPLLATLVDGLRTKHALLLLDNCEHLVEASARLAEALLRSCPHLHILASSREALSIAGETIFQVSSMSTPDPRQPLSIEAVLQYEAVRLFVDRAVMALPGFALTDENAAAIAQICYRLDGIPLAIELAAARVKLLRPEQIASRLNDRLRLLTGGSRTALPRHQTLRATLDWSYHLLSEAECVLLRSLSVFSDGWTLEAAEAVAGHAGTRSASYAVLDLLTQLVNKSLVVAEREPGADPRYRLLETIRQYAREKLFEAGEGGDVRNKHLEYFLAFAARAAPELTGPDQAAWLNRLEEELDNIRAALEWALEHEVEAGLRLASTLRRFWDAHSRSREGNDWLGQLLQPPETLSHPQVQAKALAVQATLLVTQGDPAPAYSAAEASLALFRAQADKSGEAFSLMTLGQVSFIQGDVVSGRPLLEESLALYRTLGDKVGQADALAWLGVDRRDLDRSRELLQESLALNRELGHLAGIAGSLVSLAQQAYWASDYSTPLHWLEEAMALQRQLGSKSGMAWVSEIYGNLALRQGDYEQARACYEESIALNEEAGQHLASLWARVNLAYIALRQDEAAQARTMFAENIRHFQEARINIGVIYSIEGLASLAARQGQAERAVQLFAWAEAQRGAIGDARPIVEQSDVERDLALVRAQLDAAAFVAAGAAGQAFTLDEAIAYALEQANA
ncbi:MAG TPA: tetratricopeptide repeat protein [Anaerolineae bacterium]|nr:tetratricopeptide repeat protein [Anaerolineae bacterium]